MRTGVQGHYYEILDGNDGNDGNIDIDFFANFEIFRYDITSNFICQQLFFILKIISVCISNDLFVIVSY